jgi:hypothetical protein
MGYEEGWICLIDIYIDECVPNPAAMRFGSQGRVGIRRGVNTEVRD